MLFTVSVQGFFSSPLIVVISDWLILCPPDCSYTCHLECERKVQLDCNQRDKDPGQTPAPRNHCASTEPQRKVTIFQSKVLMCKKIKQNNNHAPKVLLSLTNKSKTHFCKYSHYSSLSKVDRGYSLKAHDLHDLPTSADVSTWVCLSFYVNTKSLISPKSCKSETSFFSVGATNHQRCDT